MHVRFLWSFSAVNFNQGGEAKLIRKIYRGALILFALGTFVSVPMVNAQPSPAGNVQDTLVTHAQKSLNFAERGGKNAHLAEAIKHLNEAIEHGKAGHAGKATKHAEAGLSHLTEVKF